MFKIKKDKEIIVEINFTEGWKDKVAIASYNLYLRIQSQKLAIEEIDSIPTKQTLTA